MEHEPEHMQKMRLLNAVRPKNESTSLQWRNGPQMKEKRHSGATVVVENSRRLIVLGGGEVSKDGRSFVSRKSAEELSSRTGSFQEFTPPMLEERYGFAAAAQANAIYAVGGIGKKSAEVLSLEKKFFFWKQRRWTALPDMSTARSATTIAISNNKLYVFGGYDHTTQEELSSCECIDIATGEKWENLPPMKTTRVCGCAEASMDGKIYVMGGESRDRELATVEIFDTRTGEWAAKQGPDMPTKRSGCASVAFRGLLLVVGGYNEDSLQLSTVEVLDTENQEWSTLPSMRQRRNACGVSVVDGNTVVVTGGQDEFGNALGTTEMLRLPDDFAIPPSNP